MSQTASAARRLREVLAPVAGIYAAFARGAFATAAVSEQADNELPSLDAAVASVETLRAVPDAVLIQPLRKHIGEGADEVLASWCYHVKRLPQERLKALGQLLERQQTSLPRRAIAGQRWEAVRPLLHGDPRAGLGEPDASGDWSRSRRGRERHHTYRGLIVAADGATRDLTCIEAQSPSSAGGWSESFYRYEMAAR